MNFNLVSNEEDNGNSYTVRLSNPITIPANSSIYMNFCELTRSSKIRLYEKGKITLNIGKVFPNVLPSDQTTLNNPLVLDPAASTDFTNSFEIDSGDYTFTAFRDLIIDNLSKLVNGTHAAFYIARSNEQIDIDGDDNNIFLGLTFGQKYGNGDAAGVGADGTKVSVATEGLSVTNVFNESQSIIDATDPSGFRTVAYAKARGTGVAKQYNNYSLTKNHYFHYAFKADTYEDINSITGDPVVQNLVVCQSIKEVHAMGGATTIGLYSPEYALMSGGANRTVGNAAPRNIPTTPNNTSRLAVFCGIELTEANRAGSGNASVMRVNWGTSSIGGVLKTCKSWPNINQTISGVKTDVVGNLNDLFGANNKPVFAFQTYLDEDDELYKSEPRLYLRIFSIGAGGDPDANGALYRLIYDSKLTGEFFPKSFFEADAAFYDDANKVNSQIPFSVIMSAQEEDEGWESIFYTSLDKTVNNSDDAKPATIVDNYTLTFNDSLKEVFLQTTTPTLFPNFNFQRTDLFYSRNFSLEWRTKDYSILINTIPIQNYKNVSEKRQPAYQKAVLANIPAPFGITSNLVEPTNDDVKLIAVYQPYNPIVTDLKNQELVVNNFEVRIVDMQNEATAVEILKSIINFTIKSPM